jgi:hypothetical protein
VYRRPTKEVTENPKVSIITGGGSGHEPVRLSTTQSCCASFGLWPPGHETRSTPTP